MNGPVRSVLYLPASNARAIEKARGLTCDVAVLDLEDAVAPEAKAPARAAAVNAVREGGFGPRLGVRINGLDTEWGAADLAALGDSGVSLIIAPKVETAQTVHAIAARLRGATEIWAMIETPAAVIRMEAIAGAGGPLKGLMLGVNDLATGLRAGPSDDREPLKPWLAATVAVARTHGLLALDGVYNRIDDTVGLFAECRQGRLYGFDGKSLIHPSQIETANAVFGITEDAARQAEDIVRAFAHPDAEGRGAIRLNGAMVERLHLEAARALLARYALELGMP